MKRKIKTKKPVLKRSAKKSKIKIQENIETGDGDRFKLVNFRIEQKIEKEYAKIQSHAALFIFLFWKFKRYYRKVKETSLKKLSHFVKSVKSSFKNPSDVISVKPTQTPQEDLKSYESNRTPRSSKKYSTAVKHQGKPK